MRLATSKLERQLQNLGLRISPHFQAELDERRQLKAFSCNTYTAPGATCLAQIARGLITQDKKETLAEYAKRHGKYPSIWAA
jgi:hypothetical protein